MPRPESGRIQVLMVEHEPITRRVLEMHLDRWGYEVFTSEDGLEARDLLVAHPDVRLLIADAAVPGLDGVELCRFARSQERLRYLHVIILTVRSGRGDILAAMQAGADAFLVKPVNASELEAQVRVARRILDLDELNSRRIEELDAVNRRIQRDLEAAARVQQSFLPEPDVSLPGVRCASLFMSSQHVAGDMFNVLSLGDGRVAAYVLDVSGHGTQAALLSVSVHLLLESMVRRPRARRSLPGAEGGVGMDDPDGVLRAINRHFPVLGQSGQYFTMVYGVLDPGAGTFHYGRAGHPWPVVVTREGARTLDEASGPALGVFREVRFVTETAPVAPGEMVLLCSDGLLEARSRQEGGEEYGGERMLNVLDRHRRRGIRACVEALRASLFRFTGGRAPRDDVTILGLEVE